MALGERLLYNYLDTGTTVMTGIVKGATTGGPTLMMSMVKTGSLSALVALDAETDTITLQAFWEVSNDGVTFVPIVPLNNAANVVWATGTAGADATVTKVLPAPESIYGWRYARVSVMNLVANGLIADTYEIGYCFEKDDLLA
jgi:hypothetical protein